MAKRRMLHAIMIDDEPYYFTVIPYSGEYWEYHRFDCKEECRRWMAKNPDALPCRHVPEESDCIVHSSDSFWFDDEWEMDAYQHANYVHRNDSSLPKALRTFYQMVFCAD